MVSEQLAQNDAVAEYLRMRESALENAQQLQQREEPQALKVEEPQIEAPPAQRFPEQVAPKPAPSQPEVAERAAAQQVTQVSAAPAPPKPETDAAIARAKAQRPSHEEVPAVAEDAAAVIPAPERGPTPPSPPQERKKQPEPEVQQGPHQLPPPPPKEQKAAKSPTQTREGREPPSQVREKEEPRPRQKEDKSVSEGAKDVPVDVKVAETPAKLPEAEDSVVVTVDATDLEFGDESLNTSAAKEQPRKQQLEKEDDDPHHFKEILDFEPESAQLVSLRKISRSQSKDSSNGEDSSAKKRTWGASKYSKEETGIRDVSSKSLKDIVPDIKPLLSEETEVDLERKDEEDEGEGRRRSSNSRHASTEEKKMPKITATSSVIRIDNLVRPFTVNQIKELLARTGTLVEDSFWINKVKSTCLVAYSTKEEAEETIAALDGVKWPSSNPKQISVKPSTEEELNSFHAGTADPRQNGSGARHGREEAAPVAARPKETAEPKKRPATDDGDDADESKSTKRRRREESGGGGGAGAGKTLEELFRKTKAQPSIYWLPNDGKP